MNATQKHELIRPILKDEKTSKQASEETGTSLSMGDGKSKLDPYKPKIESLLNNGATQKFIAQQYDATEATIRR